MLYYVVILGHFVGNIQRLYVQVGVSIVGYEAESMLIEYNGI